MEHESDKQLIDIIDSDITFEKIYNKPYIPSLYINEIKNASLLLIPEESFRGIDGVYFPETTSEFYDYLRENATNELKADIAISDDLFQKLELHSAVIIITTFIVSSIVFPIAINLVSSYLYDQAKKYHRSTDQLNAEVNIIVQTQNKSKKISYKGPINGIKETLESSVEIVFKDDVDE